MKESDRISVCERTEHDGEEVTLRHIRTGDLGKSCGCIREGGTILVRLSDGNLDSWDPSECEEIGVM